MYIPSLYIYLVYTQLEMNVFYHVVYVLVHKIETINICQSFHIQSAYFKPVGVFKINQFSLKGPRLSFI